MDGLSFEIRIPRSTEWSPAVAAGFSMSLLEGTGGKGYDLSVWADQHGVRFVISLNQDCPLTQQALESLLRAYYPSVQVVPYELPKPSYPFYRGRVALGRTDVNDTAFITSVTEVRTFDPLTVVTQTMHGLEPEETLWYAVRVVSSDHPSDEEIKNILTVSAYDAGKRTRVPVMYQPNPIVSGIALLAMVFGDRNLKKQRVNIVSDEKTQAYEAKLKQLLAKVYVIAIFTTPHKARLDLLSAVSGAACNLVTSGDTRIVSSKIEQEHIRTAEEDKKYDIDHYYHTFLPKTKYDMFWLYLTADELATLWHLPHQGFASQPFEWASGLSTQLTTSQGKETIQIGTVGRDAPAPIYLSRGDRQHHTYVTGKTGMGKSTLLENLIRQDIEAGEGVAVIDPPGSLIASLLSHGIPENRVNDVVLLSCANEAYPVPINPFHVSPGVTAEEQLQAVLWLMKTLYREHWSNTRMETTIRNILQLVLADVDATPLDIQEIIDNPKRRTRLFSQLKNTNKLATSTERFWERFDNLSPSERSDYTSPVLNRLGFLGSAHLELITCHPQTVDFRQLISEKKIILIDLSGNVIASEVGMLGAIFLFNMFFASQSLFFSSKQTSHPFYLYADEVQEFVSSDLATMLSEARKYGLSLTLASQYIGQLNAETQEAIKNNVGTKISFECGEAEARETAKLYEPDITAKDMVGLGRGNAVIRTRFGGETLKPFVIHTLPPPSPITQQVDSTLITERSRENLHLLPAQDVRAWIKRRYSDDAPAQPTGLKDFE